MSPFIHGRIYPEVEFGGLLHRELRILADPRAVTELAFKDVLDIDVLRHYLRDLPGCPCKITLVVPAQTGNQFQKAYQFLRYVGVEETAEPASDVKSARSSPGRSPRYESPRVNCNYRRCRHGHRARRKRTGTS